MIRKNLLVIPGLIIFLLFGSQTVFANLTTTDFTVAQTISTPSFWRTELYFGRDKNDGTQVSDEEWSKFLDEFVTPKFPDGLTVLDGSGQYRLENGTIVNTDQSPVYHTILYPITKHLGGRHDVVNHSKQQYTERNADGTTSGVNCAESFFSLIKRGLLGTFHAVSKEHLHRYCDEFAFRWDTRKLNDGERVVEAVKRTEGKRLTYDQCVCRN